MKKPIIFIYAHENNNVTGEMLAIISVAPNGLFGVEFCTLNEKSYLGFVEPADAVRYADNVLREEGLVE